jgi:hypothetical protein
MLSDINLPKYIIRYKENFPFQAINKNKYKI